jgi:hypothetical protein
MILYLKYNLKNAKVKNDLLLYPLPKIQVGYRILTNIEEINVYMYKFPKESVLESIKNEKCTLVFK